METNSAVHCLECSLGWRPFEPCHRPGAAPEPDGRAYIKPAVRDKLIEHRESITTYGEDLAEIRDGMWTVPKAT